MNLGHVSLGAPNLMSPLEPLPSLGQKLGLELWCKRDDMLPYYYGGNKVRKIFGILQEAERLGYNALVTTGGLQSNHARVTALAAAQRGWPVVLVLHAEPGASGTTGNALIARLAGAKIVRVEPTQIAGAMREALTELRQAGHTPFEVPGGGHSVAGALGYVAAVSELAEQCRVMGGPPDYVMVASGTGTTQAGLAVGAERLGWPTQVWGVSVARNWQRGKSVIDEACAELRDYLTITTAPRPTEFFDDWTGGGYENVYPELLQTIREAALAGLLLDPTYTGKAFHGLSVLAREGRIPAGARVLFWHTGGLINLLSSPEREALLG